MSGAAPDPRNQFTDQSIDGVNIPSRDVDVQKYKAVQDKDGKYYAQGVRLQTDKIALVNRRLQSAEPAHAEAQTMSAAELGAGEPLVDEQVLVDFLRTVVPLVERELLAAWNSMQAFESYVPLWDEAGDTCEMTQQVWKEGQVDLQVTSVTWNNTGAMLACSFGRLDTLGWCDTSAPVCLWNVFRPQLNPGEPDLTIEIQGFVMCLAFHPTQPALLAGGTYNGELVLWNTAGAELDPLVASSSIDDYFHREAIQAVQWIPADLSGGPDAFLLATVSGDGKVLIWDARENDLSYPTRGFTLTTAKKRLLGGRSLSFSPLDPWLFVVGCETGTVMRCFRSPPGASIGTPSSQYAWKPSAVALLDQLTTHSARLQLQNHVEAHCRNAGIREVSAEVVFQSKPDPATLFPEPRRTDLEPHHGAVTVTTFSPFHRKLMLTGSLDGSVKLFDVLQQRAFQTFFPPSKHLSTCSVSAASWSHSRPCVFAVAMEMGGVYIYDLMKSRQEPVLELPLTGSGSQRVTSLEFNPKMWRLLSVGDENGRVRVFRLPFRLSELQKTELTFLGQLMGTSK